MVTTPLVCHLVLIPNELSISTVSPVLPQKRVSMRIFDFQDSSHIENRNNKVGWTIFLTDSLQVILIGVPTSTEQSTLPSHKTIDSAKVFLFRGVAYVTNTFTSEDFPLVTTGFMISCLYTRLLIAKKRKLVSVKNRVHFIPVSRFI